MKKQDAHMKRHMTKHKRFMIGGVLMRRRKMNDEMEILQDFF